MEETLSFSMAGIHLLALALMIMLLISLVSRAINLNRCDRLKAVSKNLEALATSLDIDAESYVRKVRKC
ncbi:MAG: hypothetical protein DRN78_03825 [Thermoproteota archaeon]|nr:MAG: hypothetical protein DRN78_03825 [Candidatus Korarchaeota archaeon]